jgi:hypothetical protein
VEPSYYSPNIVRNDNDFTPDQWAEVKARFGSRHIWGFRAARIVDHAAGHVARRRPWLRRIFWCSVPLLAVTWFTSMVAFSLIAVVTVILMLGIINYRSL